MFTVNSLSNNPKTILVNIRRMAAQGLATQEELIQAVETYRDYLRVNHNIKLNRMYVLSMADQLPD